MALSTCKDCATVYSSPNGRPGLCPECRTRPASADGPRYVARPVLQCATCGKDFLPKNQRQRTCEKLACKPRYKKKGVPRSLAPLTSARAVNAVAGYLMEQGYTEVWQSITGVGKCALVVYTTERGLEQIEVQTVVELSNGEVRFPPAKSPDSDFRAFVASSPEHSLTVVFDPALPAIRE